jgi:DNA polymerase elongation subunit (family B)
VWKRVNTVIKHKCISQKYHLPNTTENFVAQSFAVPVIFTCLPLKNEPNINKPIYLHVYGLRRAFYLSFLSENLSNIEKWFDKKEICNLFYILRGCCPQIYDLKLVYATPNLGAWEGEKFMLKVYVSDYLSPMTFKNQIKPLFKSDYKLIHDLNLNIVHDSSIPKDVKWMNKFQCDPCGYLWIKDNQAFMHEPENKSYIELHAFYKDVTFQQTELIELKSDDKHNLLTVTDDNVDLHSYVKFQISQNIEETFSTWENSKQILHKVYSQDYVRTFLEKYGLQFQNNINLCTRTAIVKQRLLKTYKEKLRILKKAVHPTKTKNDETVFKIIAQKKWLVFDIETDFEPNVPKEETILMIACSVFTHDSSNDDCLESHIFTRLPKDVNKDNIDIHQIITMVNTEFSKANIYFPHLKNAKQFSIIPCQNEKQLLLNFQNYVQESNSSFVASFNGLKFDLPFIENRYKKLVIKKSFDVNVASRYFEFSFSQLPDRGLIKYYHKYKESALKSKGIKRYVNRHRYKRINNNSSDDDEEEEEEEEEEEDNNNMQVNFESTQFQMFLKHARNIRYIAMNFITLVDVMYIVGDPMRGIKLNTAAQTFLKMNKLQDIDVEYQNIFKSWKNKTKISKLLAYCLVDTLILTSLIRVKEINLFYAAIAKNIGLPEREIYTEESMKRLTAFTNRLGYEENILTHDTTLYRDEVKLWIPESIWKPKHYNHLTPCGGSTMECFGLFCLAIFVADAHACYPSIMQSKNICSTSFIENPEVMLKKIPKDHVLTIVLENVRPVVEHTCHKERGWCPLEQPEKKGFKCKTKYRYERVTYPVHYVNKTYYTSILSRAANYLTDLRNNYKRLQKLSEGQNDKIKANIYNECQKAAKILTNSLYGATMRNFGVIGDSITYMARWQTKQLCELAQKHDMYAVNGDTDSVFLTFFKDPKVFLNFSTLASALHLDPTSTSIVDIFQRLITKANEFINIVNGNPPHIPGLFPQPYTLELEKIFLQLINLAKKSYVGDKILPDSLRVTAHRSGITGKKADASKIKTICQLMAIKLLFQRDIIGVVRFCKDIYDLGLWFIYLEEKKEKEISQAIENDRQLQLNKQSTPTAGVFVHLRFLENTKQIIQHIQTKHEACMHKTFEHFNLEMFLSYEKVGDLNKVMTLAAKRALRDYKIKGENSQNIPKVYPLCRSSKVQLGSNILKLIQVVVEHSDVSSNSHQNIIQQFQHAKLISDLFQQPKQKSITKFDVTTIPKIYHAPKSSRYQLEPHELTYLLHLYVYIKFQEENITYLNKQNQMLTCPENIENKVIEKRLWDFIKSTSIEVNPFPPSRCFQGPIAEQVIPFDSSDDCYMVPNNSLDIWEWYNRIEKQTPYIMIRYIKYLEMEKPKVLLKLITILPQEEELVFNKDQYNFVNIDEKTIVILDMDSYIYQTTITPIICPSYDGNQIYITNNTSYGIIREDYFSITIDKQQLLKIISSQTTDTLIFTGVEKSHLVSITPVNSNYSLTFAPHDIWRADGRKTTTMWKYPTGIFYVNKQNLLLALSELKYNNKEHIILSFESITQNVFLFLENRMIEITLFFKTNKIEKKEYIKDLQQLKIKKSKKKPYLPQEAKFMQNWLTTFVYE